jgi:predicted ATPase
MAVTPKSTTRFRHISLQNWRNFKKAEAELQPRVFILGANAAGKSNFLDAFKFLRDIVADGGGLIKAINDRGGVSSIRSLSARAQPAVTIDVRVGDDDYDKWRYVISFRQDNQRRPFIAKEILYQDSHLVFQRPTEEDEKDKEQLTQTYLEQVRENKDFRELAEFFRSVRYLHIVPQLIRDPDRYRGRNEDPFGWDILERIARTPEKTQKAWLKQIERRLRVAVPQLQDLTLERDERGIPHLKSKYAHWRPQGAWQTEEVFSDGTLRLLGLLWATLERAGPLLLEEPELSLNSYVVTHIPAMLHEMRKRSGRQVIVSTHSADILSNSVDLAEVLLLEPGKEGTRIHHAASLNAARAMIKNNTPLPEVVIPFTKPAHIQQLSLPLDG